MKELGKGEVLTKTEREWAAWNAEASGWRAAIKRPLSCWKVQTSQDSIQEAE